MQSQLADERLFRQTLLEVLKFNETLERLLLSISYSSLLKYVPCVSEALRVNHTLRKLTLHKNCALEMRYVAEALKKDNETLEHLEIQGSTVGEGDLTVLSSGIKENRSLQHLYFIPTFSMATKRSVSMEDIAAFWIC